jgi:uncharacterized protein (TIGR00661 family)
MRIVYGVHGYGRGHATRALAVLPHLAKRHQVLVLAGGDAHAAIAPDFAVMRIPTLAFAYGRKSGKRSNWRTFRRNFPAALDLLLNGPVFGMVRGAIADFAPDVVICDAETWTHHAAASLKIPRISFDHIGMMAYCRPRIEWRDRLEARFDTACYRLLMLEPERVIVSSFYPLQPRRPGVRVIGTLARQAVRRTVPTAGKHLLAYFNQGHHQFRPGILRALQGVGCPVHVYGTPRRGRDKSLSFLPPSNLPFLEDLASCRAVISTAGNQLMGEAAFLGKPMLVMPERCVEQRLNAAAVERLGIGIRTTPTRFSAELVHRFLDESDRYIGNLRQHKRDGLPEALSAIEQFLAELAPRAAASTLAAGDAAPTTMEIAS